MQNNTGLSPHEMLGLHELMNNEIVSLKRFEANMAMVKDNELMNYMQQYLNFKKSNLQQIQNFINNQCNLGNNQNNNDNQNNQQNNQSNQNTQNSQSGGASSQNNAG